MVGWDLTPNPLRIERSRNVTSAAKAESLSLLCGTLKPCPSTVLLTAVPRNKADEIFEQRVIEQEFPFRAVPRSANTRSFDCAD
jgi:hypothetical protein